MEDDISKVAVREPLSRSEFWMRVAGASFALWAIMIPIGVGMLRSIIDGASEKLITEKASALSREQVLFYNEFKTYTVQMESRMSTVETNQRIVLQTLQGIDRKFDTLQRSVDDTQNAVIANRRRLDQPR